MFALFDQEEVMRAYSHEIAVEAKAEGAEIEKVSAINNLMANMKWTIEQAFEALGIATTDYEKYRSLVAKSK